jgi:hypothetical protein
LAILYKQEGYKVCCWPKQIRKLLRYNKSKCSIIDGLIYYRNWVFVPNSPELWLEVIHCIYSLGLIGHLGRIKTLNLLNQTYWWLGILQFTVTFVKDCALYFYIKTPCLVPPGFLKPLELPVCLWTDISINYVVNLPKCLCNSKIYKHIFVVVDCLIKMRHFIPVTSLDIEELIKAFIYTVYKLYGALSIIISDRGSLFVSDFWCCLN